ncbi:MAG TPA: hypothetical protein VH165_22800 [Kofleriaceae bacterium]|nr:hypothetical protein [Kofleriaceae bacterium]
MASVACAVWVGTLLGRGTPGEAEARGERAGVPRGMPATPEGRVGLGAAEVRAILHDELARQLAELRAPQAAPVGGGLANAESGEPTLGAGPAPGAAMAAGAAVVVGPAAAAGPVMTPELTARADDAAGLVDRAISAGRWTGDDRRRFATTAGDLPPLVRIDLERKLHVAINRGTVAVADGIAPLGPPMP